MTKVKGQIGYCGIWCGSCVVGTGALMELARRYLAMADSHGVEHWGSEGFDYAQFSKGLECISKLEQCPGCLSGGGRDHCELRQCAVSRDVESCPDCSSFGDCPHGELLEHMRSGAREAGLAVVDTVADRERIRRQGDADLADRWWWRALFQDED